MRIEIQTRMLLFTAAALLVSLISSAGFGAGDPGPAESRYYYTGVIGSYPVQMELAIDSGDSGDLRGTYYYDSRGIPIEISGETDKSKSTVEMREVDAKGDVTGVFRGSYSPPGSELGKTIEGDWTKPDGRGSLHFKLGKVADYTESKLEQGSKIESSGLYPRFREDSKALDTINKELKKQITERQKKFFNEAKSYMAEDASFPGWTQSCDYSVEYYSPGLISLAGEVYAYTGGAHGNTFYISSSYVIDGPKVRLLKLGDLFKPGSGYLSTLSGLCVGDLKSQDAGWITNGDIKSLSEEDLSVFVISPAGLKFAFAPYAVGSYAEGPYFVTVPYRELSEIIDAEGPLARFLPGVSRKE